MKKYITTFLMAAMMTVAIPTMVTNSFAQARGRYSSERRYPTYDSRYGNSGYYSNDGYVQYNDGSPSVYDRHRKAVNIGVATGAGAIIGALIGGKKGAIIGAGAGVVTGAVITAKQRPRNYYRRY